MEAFSFLKGKSLDQCTEEELKRVRATTNFFLQSRTDEAPPEVRCVFEALVDILGLDMSYSLFCKTYSYQKLVSNLSSIEPFIKGLKIPNTPVHQKAFWRRSVKLLIARVEQRRGPAALNYLIGCVPSIPEALRKAYPGITQSPRVAQALASPR